jgi:hypothetical protein
MILRSNEGVEHTTWGKRGSCCEGMAAGDCGGEPLIEACGPVVYAWPFPRPRAAA